MVSVVQNGKTKEQVNAPKAAVNDFLICPNKNCIDVTKTDDCPVNSSGIKVPDNIESAFNTPTPGSQVPNSNRKPSTCKPEQPVARRYPKRDRKQRTDLQNCIYRSTPIEKPKRKKLPQQYDDDLDKLNALYSWYTWSNCNLAQRYDEERNFFPQPGPSNLNYYEDDDIVGYYRPVSDCDGQLKKKVSARSNDASLSKISTPVEKKISPRTRGQKRNGAKAPALISSECLLSHNCDREDDIHVPSIYEKSFTESLQMNLMSSYAHSPLPNYFDSTSKTPKSANSFSDTTILTPVLKQFMETVKSVTSNKMNDQLMTNREIRIIDQCKITPLDMATNHSDVLDEFDKHKMPKMTHPMPLYNNPKEILAYNSKKEINHTVLQLHGNAINDCEEIENNGKLKKTTTKQPINNSFCQMQCDICQKKFTRKWTLTEHMKTHLPNRMKLKCSQCSRHFSKRANLKFHCQSAHKNGNLKYILSQSIPVKFEDREKSNNCLICGKSYVEKSSLRVHLREVHERRNVITCSFCKITFRNKDGLKKHIAKIHKNAVKSNGKIEASTDFDIFFPSVKITSHHRLRFANNSKDKIKSKSTSNQKKNENSTVIAKIQQDPKQSIRETKGRSIESKYAKRASKVQLRKNGTKKQPQYDEEMNSTDRAKMEKSAKSKHRKSSSVQASSKPNEMNRELKCRKINRCENTAQTKLESNKRLRSPSIHSAVEKKRLRIDEPTPKEKLQSTQKLDECNEQMCTEPLAPEGNVHLTESIDERQKSNEDNELVSQSWTPSSHEHRPQTHIDNVISSLNVIPSWTFKQVHQNVYLSSKKPIQRFDSQPCNCKAESECSDNCLNRLSHIECSPKNCPCGERCQNMIIQKNLSPSVELFMTKKKGLGVKTNQLIKNGSYIMQYVGEIVEESVFQERLRTCYQNDEHHYCLKLARGWVIDSYRKGNNSRFVNHSCDPNVKIQKWIVQNRLCMALVSSRDIMPGEELTIDYNFSTYNPKGTQKCHCESKICRGTISKRSTGLHHNQKIVQARNSTLNSIKENLPNNESTDERQNLLGNILKAFCNDLKTFKGTFTHGWYFFSRFSKYSTTSELGLPKVESKVAERIYKSPIEFDRDMRRIFAYFMNRFKKYRNTLTEILQVQLVYKQLLHNYYDKFEKISDEPHLINELKTMCEICDLSPEFEEQVMRDLSTDIIADENNDKSPSGKSAVDKVLSTFTNAHEMSRDQYSDLLHGPPSNSKTEQAEPDVCKIRPAHVNWANDNRYLYTCDQLKPIRRDFMVTSSQRDQDDESLLIVDSKFDKEMPHTSSSELGDIIQFEDETDNLTNEKPDVDGSSESNQSNPNMSTNSTAVIIPSAYEQEKAANDTTHPQDIQPQQQQIQASDANATASLLQQRQEAHKQTAIAVTSPVVAQKQKIDERLKSKKQKKIKKGKINYKEFKGFYGTMFVFGRIK